MVGMVVVGVDAHKRTHTLVAVDQVGRKLAERTVATTRACFRSHSQSLIAAMCTVAR